ncbi:Rhamnulokinase [Staphylococcus gallinarum]|uniref:Rhamnulokinase n=1 Tax=Staphylococcus gallinarum TaxID=1293 RepID=A0A380FCX1_STAGA|nr:Rhamnulokinase [Staphylococcus gallinarum]
MDSREKNRQNVWDIDYLFEQILMSLNKAKLLGIESCYLSIDTWGVDYIFLDQKGKRLQEVVSYRDSRTNNTMDKVFEKNLKRRNL